MRGAAQVMLERGRPWEGLQRRGWGAAWGRGADTTRVFLEVGEATLSQPSLQGPDCALRGVLLRAGAAY